MFEQTFKNIDDILHKDAGCTSELDYTEQSSWLLFLKYLDALEADRAAEAELEGRAYSFILAEPFRWERWAAPKTADGRLDHHTALTGPGGHCKFPQARRLDHEVSGLMAMRVAASLRR